MLHALILVEVKILNSEKKVKPDKTIRILFCGKIYVLHHYSK